MTPRQGLTGRNVDVRKGNDATSIDRNLGYAMEFNGTDEYLTRALPQNLLTNGTFETGVNTDNWTASGATATYNDTETGKTGNYCLKIVANTGGVGIHKDNFLTVGKKYKLTLRFKSTCDLRIGRNGSSIMYGLISATSQWNTVVRTFTVDANGLFLLYSHTAGTIWIDDISITEDWKLDLNESWELIKHSNNRDFEGNEIAYTGIGNHTASYSTADKYAGTGSLKITATGAGDSGSNYVSLPSASIDSLVVGNKYTLEGFARLDPASLTYGANLLSGDGTSGWNAGNGSGSVVAGEYVLSSTTTGYIYRSINIAAGKTIKVVFKAKATSYTGLIRVYHGSSVNTINTTAITTGYVTYTVYTIAQGNQTLYVQLSSSHTGDIYFDDIEIYEATPITLTAQLGTKSVTSSALSIVAGTFTKFVLNFEATASEVNQDLKMWLSGAGSVFVDKLSLTQAYDMWIGNKAKVTDALSYRGIFGVESALSDRYAIFTDITTGRLRCDVSHGTTSVVQVDSAINIVDGNYHNIGFLLNRTGNAQSFLDGTSLVTSAMSVKIGKFLLTQALQVGSIWADKMKGQISHIQIWRFENISQSTFNSAIKGLQYPVGGGAEEVLRLTFVDGTTINNTLKDYSAVNHTITGVNIDSTNRKRKV